MVPTKRRTPPIHPQLVPYHATRWRLLMMRGWTTGWVDRYGVAHMYPPLHHEHEGVSA